MPDDSFHEIQLNGKQLVFLFMTGTVVLAVTFLCGVLVGRGVRAETSVASSAAGLAVAAVPAASDTFPTPEAVASADPTTPPPPPADEELSYYSRLEGQDAPAEDLKPSASSSAPAPAVTPPSAPPQAASATAAPALATPSSAAVTADREGAKPPSPTKTATQPGKVAIPSSPPPGEPAGGGFAVQIAALRERLEAEAVAKRLAEKGYPAYVMAPSSGSPAAVYRVRVGKFKNRRDAEQIAGRLEKEEQFKPWITR